MSYRHRLSACGQAVAEAPGVTTEISGLTTYVLGALVCNGYFWIAATIAVVSLFLLELKGVLEAVDDLNAWQRFHEFGERRPTRCRGSDGR